MEVTDQMNAAAESRLKSFIDRVERLEDEKAGLGQDIKEVLSEAKGEGYDTKIIRKVVKLLRIDKAKRAEEDAVTEMYLAAVEG